MIFKFSGILDFYILNFDYCKINGIYFFLMSLFVIVYVCKVIYSVLKVRYFFFYEYVNIVSIFGYYNESVIINRFVIIWFV